MTKPPKKRDPLKKEPLRQAGQSTLEQKDRFYEERIGPWVALLCVIFVVVIVEWYRWAFDVGISPVLFTVFGIALAVFAAIRITRLQSKLTSYTKGARGEKQVGELLDSELRPRGYHVYHDICFDGHNIDHALIGPAGVFAIETKAISKPDKGQIEVRIEGDRIFFNGVALDRDPIVQARAVAKDLRDIIRDCSGRDVAAQAVVIPVGWFVQEQTNKTNVWVLNEGRFLSYLKRQANSLDQQTIKFLSANLERYLRDQESKSRAK